MGDTCRTARDEEGEKNTEGMRGKLGEESSATKRIIERGKETEGEKNFLRLGAESEKITNREKTWGMKLQRERVRVGRKKKVGLRNRGEVEDKNNGGRSLAVERDFEREIEREQGREEYSVMKEIRESENVGMRRGAREIFKSERQKKRERERATARKGKIAKK